MKHVKMLVLAAVAAGALMAVIGAGTASATVLCSTTVETCPTAQKWPFGMTLDFSISSGSSAKLTQTNGEAIDTCTVSTVKGTITNTGSAFETVSGPVDSMTWENCTFPTKTLAVGNLEVHRIAGTSNGTVTAYGTFEVTVNTVFFGSCAFSFGPGISIGDLKEGKPATFAANAVSTKVAGGAACPVTAKWSANYTLTTSPITTTLSVSDSTD